MCRNRSRSLRSFIRQAVARMSSTSTPTNANTAVKMLSTKTLVKLVRGAAQPLINLAAAGLGQVASVINAGDVLLK